MFFVLVNTPGGDLEFGAKQAWFTDSAPAPLAPNKFGLPAADSAASNASLLAAPLAPNKFGLPSPPSLRWRQTSLVYRARLRSAGGLGANGGQALTLTQSPRISRDWFGDVFSGAFVFSFEECQLFHIVLESFEDVFPRGFEVCFGFRQSGSREPRVLRRFQSA